MRDARVLATFARGLALLACAAAVACVEKTKPLSKAEEAERARIVLRAKPTPTHALDFDFGGKVRLIGYDLAPETVRVGEPVRLTWYWEVAQPPGEGWKLFTHLADARRRSRINLDATRMVRRVYPEAKWKAGDWVKDVQEITLPRDWNSSQAIFYIGLYKDDERMPVLRGKHDGSHRAEALRLPVEASAEREPTLPRLIPRYVTTPIVIDGKFDEADWAQTQPSGPFVNTMTGGEGSFRAEGRLLYDAKHLYVAFEVSDEDLRSPHENPDDHLWEQDAVEIMLDPGGDARNYFEIQVSPRGVTFDTRYDTPRSPRPFGDQAWSSRITAKVALDGTLDDDQDDRGYAVEIALPWSALLDGANAIPPPAAGDVWRVNFYVMDKTATGQRSVGWSPPRVGDFHVPARFGRLAFTRGADGSLPAMRSTTATLVAPAPAVGQPVTTPRPSPVAPEPAVPTPSP